MPRNNMKKVPFFFLFGSSHVISGGHLEHIMQDLNPENTKVVKNVRTPTHVHSPKATHPQRKSTII